MTTVSNEQTNMRGEAPPGDSRQGNDFTRTIGTAFGSLGGVGILFLSVLSSQPHNDLPRMIAIVSFAVALPSLVFATVLAFAFPLLRVTGARTSKIRLAVSTTVFAGVIGTLGIFLGLAGLLWQMLPVAAVAFVGGTILALVAYVSITYSITHQIKSRRHDA